MVFFVYLIIASAAFLFFIPNWYEKRPAPSFGAGPFSFSGFCVSLLPVFVV
jgi:hypothetical protein